MYKSELVKGLEEIWKPSDYCDFEVKVKEYDQKAGTLSLCVSKMYEYVEVNFEILQKISELMRTVKINLGNKDFSPGCSTCDYGSNYWTNIHFREFWIPLEEDPVIETKRKR